MTREMILAMAVVIGLMVGAVICLIMFRFVNKDKKIKTEYDERQKELRGIGYTIGFYSMVAYFAVESLLSIAGIVLPLPEYIVDFIGIIFGLTVMCVYSIWHGVYWGINSDIKRYRVVLPLVCVLNIIPVVSAAIQGGFDSTSSVDSLPLLNVIVLLMMAVVFITFLIRKIADKNSAEED